MVPRTIKPQEAWNRVAASLKAQAEIARIDMGLYEDGNLSADPTLLEASSALLDGLAGLDDPVLFETTVQEPMVYRLSEILGTVPPLLLFVPQVALAFAAFRACVSSIVFEQKGVRR